ncbi:MAG: CRR6 family NdhI maturation factor [Synechococcaceae cyanobacterium]
MPADRDPIPADRSLHVSAEAIRSLDLSPLDGFASLAPADLLRGGSTLELHYDWPRAEDDPRELSEIPEPRLWTLRADAHYPWLPLVIERSNGQLTRHVAMLLPHGFSRSEGIRFAPEALELWLTHRLYLLDHWAAAHGLNCRQGLAQMAAVLGLELDASFWNQLDGPDG